MKRYQVTFTSRPDFTGEYLSIPFAAGKGETDSAWLAQRCRDKGLEVTEPKPTKPEK